MFYSPLQSMWDLTTHPPWGPASSLAHRPVSDSDTICKSQNPPLADIVRFGPLHIAVSLTILKHVYKVEVSTLL